MYYWVAGAVVEGGETLCDSAVAAQRLLEVVGQVYKALVSPWLG